MTIAENGSFSFAASDQTDPNGTIRIVSEPPAFAYAALTKTSLRSAPIRKDWIIDGTPQARLDSLSMGTNGWSSTDHWDCTAGRFHWHFFWDETVLFLEGEVHITDDRGNTYVGRPGVSMMFPVGTHAIWHVPVYVRKIAFNRRPIPWAVSMAMKVDARLKRLFQRSDSKPFAG
ncbi:DUF861 domain-containing protein [Microvirga tunisiensis]|uniref:DUF861 domain-containing protein n=2 Tax=Pannonibacter tanglangensis TaxID=2750084 RepID=A0A7X5F690_9HYPH|nr:MULTISPECIES: cupin domain-containing protein [unclassified Pannonibacter]NBN65993.1 DUF861 domain-containing protein [Pannonibacter sp. XCT-34]NBN80488.1 DUF861 domain-containing protein [Pannonibacter sp. XCT-53]